MKQFWVILTAILLTAYTNCGPVGKGSVTTTPSSGLQNPGSSTNPLINQSAYFSSYQLPSASSLNQLENDFISPVSNTNSDNRYAAALYGMAKEVLQFQSIDIQFESIEVATQFLNNGSSKLPVQIFKSGTNKIKKAPLAIIVNPLYSGEFAYQMNRYIEYFGQRGFHVAVIASPWSPDVLSRFPTFMPGDVWTEAKMIMEVVDKVARLNIGLENISGTTMVGLSYGAFLSAVVKYYDSKTEQPIIDGPTILLNPPHDIIHSLKNIDRQVQESASVGASCLLSGGFNQLLAKVLSSQSFTEADLNENCSKYFFTTIGFRATLMASVGYLNLTKNLGLSASEVFNITYEQYINDVAKISPKAGESDLGYWLAESKSRGYTKFIVLSSEDDNINENKSLANNLHFNFDDSNWIRLQKGGHTGFRASKSRNPACTTDWNTCMFDLLFP